MDRPRCGLVRNRLAVARLHEVAAMTAPDTRPRCATCGDPDARPGAPVSHEDTHAHPFQPAPTPSGDGRPLSDLWKMLRETWDNAFLHYEKRWGEPMPSGKYPNDGDALIARIEAAIRAEPSRALQEAREGWRLANEAAERLLPIANRAESAEQRLREVEDERDRLRARMLEFAEWCEIPGVAQRDFTILADRLRRAATPSTDEEGRA